MSKRAWGFRLFFTALVAMTAPPSLAQPHEKETWIPVYITPYYEAAQTREGAPRVAVNNGLNELLSSNKQADILAARDLVEANPATITPFSLMTLAIRMYDTGLRDDAVLWFYIGKYRAVTLVETVTFSRGPMSDGVYDAIGSYITLAGPYFNGYAFCDPDKQKATNTAAIDWVEAHPYQTIYAPGLASRVKPGGVEANLAKSIASLRESAAKEAAQMDDPEFRAEFMETRKQNGMDVRFCWSA